MGAVESTPNLNEAADQLGASRRTLQNRMREYDLPYGQAGRRKQELTYSGDGFDLPTLVVVGVAFGLGWWWMSRKKESVGAGWKSDCLHGLDVIRSR